MKKIFLGKKVGMTQLVDSDGKVTAVTVLKADPCVVVDIQPATVGVTVVLGAGDKKKNVTKPIQGFFEKRGLSPKTYLKGFRVIDGQYVAGQELTLDQFVVNELVSVRGKTIGRGFTGTIKRHNFKRGPMSHGSKSHRIPGSIGAGTTPGRVLKGTRMAGHYGDAFVTVKNLRIVKVDTVSNLLFISGAVPGKSGFVEVYC